MAATGSTLLTLGTAAPDFTLPDYHGELHSLSEFRSAKGLVVAFICSHCPFVKHVRDEFARFAREYQAQGVAVVAIVSNDLQVYPQDGPAGMKQEAETVGYTFPYLLDETQAVARAYQAVCTPDFYLFDGQQKLFYRGQFDASRPKNGLPATGADLRAASNALLAGQAPVAGQQPSMGCGIKWKAGNQPAYA